MAVAVCAISGPQRHKCLQMPHSGNSLRIEERFRYAGLKSCPHVLMQCASSTTNRAKFPYSINKADFRDIAMETVEEELETGVQLEQLGCEVEEFQTRRIDFGAGAEFLVHLVFHRAWLRVRRNSEAYTVATQIGTGNAAAGAFQERFDLVLKEGTKTMVTPLERTAGTWKHRLFPPPVHFSTNTSCPAMAEATISRWSSR